MKALHIIFFEFPSQEELNVYLISIM